MGVWCRAAVALGILASCSEKDGDSHGAHGEADADTDTDSDADGDTDTDTDVSCEPIDEGRWTMGGTQFGMTMAADVAVDVAACAFAFSNWNMAMSVPDGGTMNGTAIQLTGSDDWSTCTGVAESATEASGTCASGGSWTMSLP